jgi:hypothetical protein
VIEDGIGAYAMEHQAMYISAAEYPLAVENLKIAIRQEQPTCWVKIS